ncbi:MAG: ribonuclease P protein component [Candidatus Cloacimonetes bacterium]|jgi:ribonuclease P protein component|nr:ribonuclease P protein component [Candidatus Cloacimonadota bacterium]MDD4155614.1 ribonuclease P protein component [Candidatus Cloacimonadota bacterium]
MLRLTSTKDYTKLRQSQKKIVGQYFIVIYVPENNYMESAAGITVSKKVGNAVVRNKVKRRIRAFLRQYSLRPSIPGFICNIIALKPVISADWISFKRDLQNCLDRLINTLCHYQTKSPLL